MTDKTKLYIRDVQKLSEMEISARKIAHDALLKYGEKELAKSPVIVHVDIDYGYCEVCSPYKNINRALCEFIKEISENPDVKTAKVEIITGVEENGLFTNTTIAEY